MDTITLYETRSLLRALLIALRRDVRIAFAARRRGEPTRHAVWNA